MASHPIGSVSEVERSVCQVVLICSDFIDLVILLLVVVVVSGVVIAPLPHSKKDLGSIPG